MTKFKKLVRNIKAIGISLFVVFLINCYFSELYAGEVIKIGGCGSSLGAMKLIALAFEKKYPDIKVTVLSSLGSLGGVKAVSKNGVDIGITGRKFNKEEAKLGLQAIEYAKTPIIFIVNKNVKLSNITQTDVINIFKGNTKNWTDGEKIRPILRQPSESNAIIIRNISPEISNAMDIAMSREWRIMALTDQETVDLVEKTPGAFSFSTLTQIISEKRNVNILSYNGISPLLNGKVNTLYPIYKTHYMIVKPGYPDTVRKFILFVKSSEGRKILTETGNLVID